MVPLSTSIAFHARTQPDRVALVYEDQRVGYGELMQRIRVAAGVLRARGVGPGDVVGLLMKNSAAFIEVAFAASHIGAVLLPINYRLSADEVGYILDHAGARLLCVDEELVEAAGSFAARVVLDASAQRDSGRLARAPEPVTAPHASQPEDLFRLMYTSGTTDRPKGVIHSYANEYWKCFDQTIALGLHRDERLLVVGPLYHVGAFDLPGIAVLMLGGMLCVLRDFDPEAALAAIERERLTGGWMAPSMLNRTLAYPGRERFDLASFRWLIGGGERTPEERIREFSTLFEAARYIDAYGLTESCSGDTFMEAGREIEKIGSVGRATPFARIEVRDDEGRALPGGTQGEICLLGPKITRGYWRDPAKTAASFHADGWFRSGDVGYLDDEGFLTLTDRKKDMIISGGVNVYPAEIEAELLLHPRVRDAAVVGIPHPTWGEVGIAFVVAGDEPPAAEEVVAFLEARLARYKVPREFVFVDVLPRTPYGKVVKGELRERYLSTEPSREIP